MTAAEFSRPLRVDRVPRGGSQEHVTAEREECEALARRLELPALHGLSATLTATPWRGGGLKVEGELVADLEQVSVVSLETFRSDVRFPVLRYFRPASAIGDAPDAAEIDPIVNGEVDLGEVVAETLALELDPYPRKGGESFAESDTDAKPEAPEKSSPFAMLAHLKDNRR
jgi:hypothetical protein